MVKSNKNAFEELYLQQKKKSSVLMIVTIVLVITTAGSLIWGFNKSGGNSMQPPAGFQGGSGQGMMSGGPTGQMDFTRFFNDDDTVNTEAIQDMIGRLPSGASSQFLERFTESINQAAKDGKITQSQADALIKAFGSAEGSNEN